ncbi:MAG TPA: sigma factor-like helix-turn-helix DNA-binding protein [Solirubrobacteraceae bacterium]
MSPLSLRRYRAERLLRREFDVLRSRVIGAADRRLRAAGIELDRCDLESCYAAAWQGLYMTTLEGAEVANPTGWLVLATFRRAVDERRARARAHCDLPRTPDEEGDGGGHRHGHGGGGARRGLCGPGGGARERDLAAELDDRDRLRQLFEGLRTRLSAREREAAVLCYLQGLTRSEAAARMGVSETRMRKLMEGRGPGSPGVAGKVGALVTSIRDGDWCEEQGSLMRALAFGVLEPQGERHQLALAHTLACPGCRTYVASLRGLAGVLPPVLAPLGLAAGGGIAGGWGGRLGAAVSTSGAAGAGAGAGGAAGGGWMLAGGALGGKLAVGCLVALGVGAGCAVLDGRVIARPHPQRRAAPVARVGGRHAASAVADARLAAQSSGRPRESTPASIPAGGARSLTPAGRASREFGPEQLLAAAAHAGASGSSSPVAASQRRARAAAAGGSEQRVGGEAAGGAGEPVPPAAAGGSGAQVSSISAAQAAREFSPG